MVFLYINFVISDKLINFREFFSSKMVVLVIILWSFMGKKDKICGKCIVKCYVNIGRSFILWRK